jgi:Arm DNA-binding domain
VGLTVKRIAKVRRQQGTYHDRNGLYLRVSGASAASWLGRVEYDGKIFWPGLGSLADVSLEEARDLWQAERKRRSAVGRFCRLDSYRSFDPGR